jgi:hypothetical protein
LPGQHPNQLLVVHLAKLVAAGQAAGRASMQDISLGARDEHGDRLHQPLAARGPVAWMNVHVLGPEAARAVICEAVALDQSTAACAHEVLDPPGEATAHLNAPSGLKERHLRNNGADKYPCPEVFDSPA